MSAEDLISAAFDWLDAENRWLYCLDLLGLIESRDGADRCESEVSRLEATFESILMEEMR